MVVCGGARAAAAISRSSLRRIDPDCGRPRIGDWVRDVCSFCARYCDTGRLAATRWCNDSSWTGRMEIMANAAPHLGGNACRLLGSHLLVLDHGERTWGRSDADTAFAGSYLRPNVDWQRYFNLFQLTICSRRCACPHRF